MNVNAQRVGSQIAALRKGKHMTQNELGERLNVTFQAVSKWERGETIPDVGTLVDLADVLQTTVDYLLRGGEQTINYKGKITVSDMREGMACLGRMGELLGKENPIYCYAIAGINERMNTSIEESFTDDRIFEAFVAEAIIQRLMDGYYIDLTDVKNGFRHEQFRKIVCQYAERYGIK